MIKVLSNLKKAQKIGMVILATTAILFFFLYKDYETILGVLAGAGVGLLFWSKDPQETKK